MRRRRGITGTDEYTIQIAADQTFLSPIYTLRARCCNYTLQGRYDPLPQGNYFWRIGAGSSGFTEPLAFRVFIGKRPFDDSWTQDQRPRFTWTYNAFVSNYILQVSTNPNFTNLVVNESVGRATAYRLSDPLPYGRYYWRVYPQGQPPINNISYTFAISTPPPLPPRQLSPLPDAEMVPTATVFGWEPVEGAAAYEIQISEQLDFSDAILLTAQAGDIQPDPPLFPGAYFWRIRSVNEYGVAGDWSPRQVFFVVPFGSS